MGVGLQKCAFLSHTILDVIPSVSSAFWRFLCEWWLSASAVVSCIRIVFLCDRWLQWGSVVLILRIRIVWYWCYLPCSLYQTCLVRDTATSNHSMCFRIYMKIAVNPASFCPFSYVFSISLLITSPPGRAVASLMMIVVSSSLHDNNKNNPTSTTTCDDNCNGHQLDSNGERN